MAIQSTAHPVHIFAAMPQPESPKQNSLQKSDGLLRCKQCGDLLDAASVQRLAMRPVLCRDCAFDQMPCTD
jgi:hypothetical protein